MLRAGGWPACLPSAWGAVGGVSCLATARGASRRGPTVERPSRLSQRMRRPRRSPGARDQPQRRDAACAPIRPGPTPRRGRADLREPDPRGGHTSMSQAPADRAAGPPNCPMCASTAVLDLRRRRKATATWVGWAAQFWGLLVILGAFGQWVCLAAIVAGLGYVVAFWCLWRARTRSRPRWRCRACGHEWSSQTGGLVVDGTEH